MKLINTAQAAEMLGISKATLDCWRSSKRYEIPFYKIGKCVRYKEHEIFNFIEGLKSRTFTSGA